MMSVKRHPKTTQRQRNMIYKQGKELSARYIGRRAIAAVYHGAKVVWEAVSSCFASGFWQNDKPWSNDDAWQN
jgi:hypothetical protein